MFLARIDPQPMPKPGFLGLTDLGGRARLKKGDLAGQFFGLPDIVGIEKGEEFALTGRHPTIARGRDAPLGLQEIAYGPRPGAGIFVDELPGCVPRRGR